MPPKKGPAPKVKKVVDDKTFGMKNKKGGAVQKQIKQLNAQVENNKSVEEKRKLAEKAARERDIKLAEDARRENASLLNTAQAQKVPFGTDPKTIVCQFWKRGNCDKGKKCKFAHDMAVERKSQKKSLYTDAGEETEKEKDDMATWDEEKLRTVVTSKHGNPRTTTDKVCKFFLDAVENQKYGWFWTCPNGGEKCMYRHTLPPGFVYKTREQRIAEKELHDKLNKNALTLEDWLESERYKLGGPDGTPLTPVTAESFAKWKKERINKKQAEEEARAAKEATGRMLFEQGGWRQDDLDKDSESEDDDGGPDDVWNLSAMRRETEVARQRLEEERLAKAYDDETKPGSRPSDDSPSDDVVPDTAEAETASQAEIADVGS